MAAFRRFVEWLGPARLWAIFFLLAGTGLISLVLNAAGQQLIWVRQAQSVLVILFLVGTAVIVILRFEASMRRMVLFVIGPAIIALSLGLFFSNLFLFFLPIAVGWIVLAVVGGLRVRVRGEYQIAIKHMRNREYKEAIEVMTDLIKTEPENADHLRFRAEIYRLSGKLRKARDDYQRVVELTPQSGVGYNGLAEVCLQEGDYDEAIPFAQKALELEPQEWVPPYNLGMIEDRRANAAATVQALTQALQAGIPNSRHRLLSLLWMARAYARQGDSAKTADTLNKLEKERDGLKEWQTIFESEEAVVLRNVLQADIELARKLVEDRTAVALLTA